jgi:hypothetical protein
MASLEMRDHHLRKEQLHRSEDFQSADPVRRDPNLLSLSGPITQMRRNHYHRHQLGEHSLRVVDYRNTIEFVQSLMIRLILRIPTLQLLQLKNQSLQSNHLCIPSSEFRIRQAIAILLTWMT